MIVGNFDKNRNEIILSREKPTANCTVCWTSPYPVVWWGLDERDPDEPGFETMRKGYVVEDDCTVAILDLRTITRLNSGDYLRCEGYNKFGLAGLNVTLVVE